MSSEASAENTAQHLLDLGLVDAKQLQIAWASLGTREVDQSQFYHALVRQGVLTNFQVDRLGAGDRFGFFYGDYKVLYLVGVGTFARVFRAVHRETGQVVAVKVLRSRYSDNPNTYRQFIHEGEAGKLLRHPNIVPIYDVLSIGRSHFIVMEFVEGQNLREFVKIRGKFDPLEATDIILDACMGLAYAVGRGLYHRDLKLSNVLVSSRGRGKIVDFGMAGITEHYLDTQAANVDNNTARTVDYAALERITRVHKHDSRSDIYFMGCMYYNLLAGQAPLFETRERAKRMSKQRFLDVKPLQEHDPHISAAALMVVNKAMSLDVDKRYQSMADMVEELEKAKHRLEHGTGEHPLDEDSATHEATPKIEEVKKYSIMVVESNHKMQDVFRSSFKKAGYKVLVTSDPSRAVDRFFQDPNHADFIVFNAQLLGIKAVKGFNRLGEDVGTQHVPAILLLDENQKAWAKKCVTAPHRLIIGMPVTMKGLRGLMAKVLEKREKKNAPKE